MEPSADESGHRASTHVATGTPREGSPLPVDGRTGSCTWYPGMGSATPPPSTPPSLGTEYINGGATGGPPTCHLNTHHRAATRSSGWAGAPIQARIRVGQPGDGPPAPSVKYDYHRYTVQPGTRPGSICMKGME